MGLFRRKIGLALGAGGAKGLAHIGVLKALEMNNIKIDYIAGTSIGALVGGLYALTKDVKLIENICFESQTKEFIESFSDLSLTSGLLKGEKLLDVFSNYITDTTLIEDTKIPFAVVTVDLRTGKKVILREGSLKKAIRASISLPIVFNPLEYGDHLLVDGALIETVPIKTVKEMGAQKVIGVNLYTSQIRKELKNDLSITDVAGYSIYIALHSIADQNMRDADVKLIIPMQDIPLTDLGKDPTKHIELGYNTTVKHIKELKRL